MGTHVVTPGNSGTRKEVQEAGAKPKIKLTALDRSLYFKGLLLLARKDQQITAQESQLMMKVGHCLDFEPGFCESTIHAILDNKFIIDAPPVFSSKEIAARFISGGITLGSCDHKMAPDEIEWLEAIAHANEIDFKTMYESWKTQMRHGPDQQLEAEHFLLY